MTAQPFHIVFALFDNLTQLDFTGPHQVLSRMPGAVVTVASAAGGNIVSDGGLTFAGTVRLADVADCQMICVPGGYGTTDAMGDPEFLAQVTRLAQGADYITSVCTGSLALAACGLLTGKRAACHWAWRDMLIPFGAIPDTGRVVRDGNVITGGGVTAGIDFALTVVAEVAGDAAAQVIQLTLEYAPAPPFNAGRPDLAPPHILAQVQARLDTLLPPRRAAALAAAERLKG
jgi:transcriptional regulator GlxA family with amidase domain